MPADWQTPPNWLPEDARPWWPVIVDELRARGQLRRVTPRRAAYLVQAIAQYHRVTSFLNEHGQVSELRNDKGEVRKQEPAPEFKIQHQLLQTIAKLEKAYGIDEEPTAKEDPLEALRSRLDQLASATGARN